MPAQNKQSPRKPRKVQQRSKDSIISEETEQAPSNAPYDDRQEGFNKKKKKRGSITDFSHYIRRMFKKLTDNNELSGMSLSRKTINITNSFACDMLEKLAAEAGRLCNYGKSRPTLGTRDMSTAVKLLVGKQLKVNAISEGTQAVARLKEHLRLKGSSS